MSYKKRRTRTGGPVQTDSPAAGSGDDVSRRASGAFGDASELLSPELIVFVASDNLGGAQMATAWFQTLAEPRKARAVVASPQGIAAISPNVVAALRETGGDLRTVYARALSTPLLSEADLVVTMGRSYERSGLGGTTAPSIRREHWMIPGLEAPLDLERARDLRDVIRSRVAMLVFTEGWARADISRDAARVTRPRRGSELLAIA